MLWSNIGVARGRESRHHLVTLSTGTSSLCCFNTWSFDLGIPTALRHHQSLIGFQNMPQIRLRACSRNAYLGKLLSAYIHRAGYKRLCDRILDLR